MKKSLLFIVSIFTLIGACLLVGCDTTKTKSKLHTDKNILAMSAISSTNIFDETSNVCSARAKSLTPEEEAIKIAKIHEYLKVLENMLLDNGPIQMVDEVSDKAEYLNKISFSCKKLTNETISYTLYFNQELSSGIEEKDDEEKEEITNIEESEYTLSGIAIVGDKEYKITGEKEIEEGELELSLRIYQDETNFIDINQEIEEGEVEYNYDVYSNNTLSYSMSLEMEEGSEIEYQIVTTNDGVEERIVYSKETEDGVEEIKVLYTTKDLSYTVEVTSVFDKELDQFVYQYKIVENGEVYIFTK